MAGSVIQATGNCLQRVFTIPKINVTIDSRGRVDQASPVEDEFQPAKLHPISGIVVLWCNDLNPFG